MNTTEHSPDSPFDVVILGAGLGIYALTRAFHEEYGVVSTVVSVNPPEPMRRSITCTPHVLPESTEEARLEALRELAAARPADRSALLLCNSDGDVEFIARNVEELSALYTFRFPDHATVEELSDKAEFARICTEHGIATPATEILDFRGGQRPSLPELPFDYPVVAKPAQSHPHRIISMPGKQKIYFLSSPAELDDLIARLHGAGFENRFVVQELIPGDDTSMRSITAYRDGTGMVTLMCGAQVLLEEHTPDALGRPAAMITMDLPEQFAQARAILEASDYRGFANFDIKVDPRDGSQRFLEVNPRMGRNNYYVTGGGANIARFLVEDALHGRSIAPVVGVQEILYSILPLPLLLRYVTDPERRRWVRSVARRGTVNPWDYPREGLWMRAYARAVALNHVRKFLKHYPRPTETGF
ncbi:carboxylate--amine ligase [Brachybacterium sp. JHP9]|uniref:Carboxylate--amine ligase n=1 Tax=Brachybacterium equifaecis TaxID=2910770 RepID=A0ABT0QW48_9MICO|nr:carboxylate--amine ligase [Brachybacterium equifaecis]MCL6421892.1 carboxylate--amine ligase [Brachybacterium equifaecis]